MVSMRCVNHSITDSIHIGIRVGTCRDCRRIRFGDPARGIDTWDSMSTLFGRYELVGRIDAVLAPATEVLAYRSRSPGDREALRVAPPHQWFRVNEHLWMCHDETVLLLAHGWPSVSRGVGA